MKQILRQILNAVGIRVKYVFLSIVAVPAIMCIGLLVTVMSLLLPIIIAVNPSWVIKNDAQKNERDE